jgi:TonB family protein
MIALLSMALVAHQVMPVAVSQPGERVLLAWMPGPVQCDRTTVPAISLQRPLTWLAWPGQREGLASVTYRFRIDASGRPLSITRDGTGYVTGGEDIAPSLAASRFAGGSAHEECAITYTARSTPLALAPIADLMAYTIAPTNGALPPAGWDRITPVDATCRRVPQPQGLTQVFPHFDALPATPGARNWSMVRYDINPAGRPTNVRVVEGTRNAALDTASVRAMKGWRFTRGARSGCLYPFWRSPAPMPAPASPARSVVMPTDNHCPIAATWTQRPPPVYPPAWHRRAIEGWAIVAFDVAPWGDIGNLRVVASEPSAEFGEQALRTIRGARKPASATGHTGCFERVRFVLDAKATPPGDG